MIACTAICFSLLLLGGALEHQLAAAQQVPSEIAGKLDHQFKKYENGRAYLVDANVKNGTFVTREEWEALLSPEEGLELTQQDNETLLSFHATIIEKAAEKAREESIINVDEFRNDKDAVQQFCLDFPRAALLHIHPEGTMKQDTIDHLLNEINPVIDTEAMIAIGQGELTTLYPSEIEYLEGLTSGLRYLEYAPEDQAKIAEISFFLPSDPCCHDFSRFESLFSLQFLLLGQNQTYTHEILHKDFFERNKAYGISYVEFTTPRFPPNLENLQVYNDELEQWSEDFDMTLNYNHAFVRTFPVEMNINFTRDFVDAMSSSSNTLERVVGIDLLAEEAGNPALETAQQIYIPIWHAWQNGSFPLGGMTMHAGESGEIYGSRNVRDGMIFGVTRIGHGPLLFREPLLMEYARRKQVPMVMNIVSNWQLNVITNDDYDLHPFIEFIRLGIPLTLSTDDEGMFNTDIVNECVVAIENSDIQYSELKQISYTAVAASFADNATKTALLEELNTEFQVFEEQYGADMNSSSTATITSFFGLLLLVLVGTGSLVV